MFKHITLCNDTVNVYQFLTRKIVAELQYDSEYRSLSITVATNLNKRFSRFNLRIRHIPTFGELTTSLKARFSKNAIVDITNRLGR